MAVRCHSLLTQMPHKVVDIDLVRQLVEPPPAIDLARRLNVTPRTIRNRRDRITDRLREVALAA